MSIIGATDASYGTAPKGRSVSGHTIRLGEKSGAILAKSKASTSVVLSSFEAELDGTANAVKSIARVSNIAEELRLQLSAQAKLWNDNRALVDYLNGSGVAKGVRHMELRSWYIREKIEKNDLKIGQTAGTGLVADKLTKLGERAPHAAFTYDIMGLALLGDDKLSSVELLSEEDESIQA